MTRDIAINHCQCYIGVVSHGNNSSSEQDWPAGAFGTVRPVGAILPTATMAGPFSLLAADGYDAPNAPAGKHVLHFCDFKTINEVVFEDTKI